MDNNSLCCFFESKISSSSSGAWGMATQFSVLLLQMLSLPIPQQYMQSQK